MRKLVLLTAIAVGLAFATAVAAQGNLASARTSYSKCLGAFARSQVKAGADAAAFEASLATACKAEEAAFRHASIATDVAARISRATAEQNATEEIGYIHENAIETFKASLPEERR